MSDTEEHDRLIRQMQEIGHRENEADAQHIALLWPQFGIQRHLRSEAAWRYAALWWEDYTHTDDPPSLAQRYATLGEKLKLYNDFFATETFIGLDPEVVSRSQHRLVTLRSSTRH